MAGHGPRSAEGREIPAEILREILLRLPTRDVTRCSSVSWQWFLAIKNPTFRKLHAASHAVAAAPLEVLLVSEHQDKHRCFIEASISNVSLRKPMCRVTLPPEYRLTNVCGGFLCFAPATMHMEVSPVFVCNPVTGERLALPRPPMCGLDDLVALGFSPSTKELKLFRYTRSGSSTPDNKYLDVYTLGESSGWRRCPYLSQHSPVHGSHLPVLVDGKLYVLIDRNDGDGRRTHRILVIDVASEMHCTYRLPRIEANAPVNAFELRGRLCLAVNTGKWGHHPKVQFRVMPPLDWLDATTNDDNTKLNWDLLYSFDLDSEKASRGLWSNAPRGAWLEDDEILCYRLGDTLYKYDTCGHPLIANNEPMQWDQKLILPPTPQKIYRRWGIYSGYRSNLLSPLIFRPPPSEEEEKITQFENVLLETLRLNKSKGLSTADTTDEPAAKRICS